MQLTEGEISITKQALNNQTFHQMLRVLFSQGTGAHVSSDVFGGEMAAKEDSRRFYKSTVDSTVALKAELEVQDQTRADHNRNSARSLPIF